MDTKPRIDWRQILCPGPRREFTPEEMAKAGDEGPSPTMELMGGINIALVAFITLQIAPPEHTARLTAALAAMVWFGYASARSLWRRPSRAQLMKRTVIIIAAIVLLVGGIVWRLPKGPDVLVVASILALWCVSTVALLSFLVIWRSQQIALRLRELVEREKAIEMARRLAAAQIEPHFLFNTLASVQHWLSTGDERAAPLLESLTGYLRATLPLFEKPLLAAGEELVAVRRYFEVMQSRMGARLSWKIDVDPALESALLPPGLLLTLVENAIAHGVEPRLAGGQVDVLGRRHGSEALFAVVDDGPGPGPDAQPGVGLANARQRLALAYGSNAKLELLRAAPGCRAEIRLGYKT